MSQQSRVSVLAEAILSNSLKGASDTLDLEEFKQLYRSLEKLARERGIYIGKPQILILTEQALVRFSIAPDSVIYVTKKVKPLSQSDFEIVLEPEFQGNIRPVTLPVFVWTEIRLNGLVLLIIGAVLLALLHLQSGAEAVPLINQMLVEANALFIGIFVLFTVGQNRDYLISRELRKKGMTHQFIQNDKFVVRISITSLLLAFLSTAAFSDQSANARQIVLPMIQTNIDLNACAIVFTVLALLLLMDCFLSITKYYLRLMTKTVEAKMTKDWIADSMTEQTAHSSPKADTDSE